MISQGIHVLQMRLTLCPSETLNGADNWGRERCINVYNKYTKISVCNGAPQDAPKLEQNEFLTIR